MPIFNNNDQPFQSLIGDGTLRIFIYKKGEILEYITVSAEAVQ